MGLVLKSEWEYALIDTLKNKTIGYYETEGLAFQQLQKKGKKRTAPSGRARVGLESIFLIKRIQKGTEV